MQVFYKGVSQDKHWMTEVKKGTDFWETKQPRNGILMNLLQSPWFPAYSEYYEQVKSSSAPNL